MVTVFDQSCEKEGKQKKFAVIGHPIGHTLSPFIHSRLFALSGIEAEYAALDVEEPGAAMELLRGLCGFNITIPHKKAIIPFLDEIDPKARAFGSVNTVGNFGGRLKGFTTDGAGCLKALQNHGSGFEGDLLLLGNGGAARAIAFEALPFFSSLTIAVRNREHGEALGRDLLRAAPEAEIRVITLAERPEKSFDLLINTTSVGMYPHGDACPAEDAMIKRCGTVFDAVYNPADTVLLQRARAFGCRCIGGMEMLVYQAVAAHEHWYGASFQKEEIEKLCRKAQEALEEHWGRGVKRL